MKIPQPFQYQGSKRMLAPIILQYFPKNTQRVIEPFSGSAAISIACAAKGHASEFWLNDVNKPLAELLKLIISNPEKLCNSYADIWCDKTDEALEKYYRIREDFNHSNDPSKLLYLLARCVKGSVRYNADGLFNQSPDKRRLGTRPETMRKNISNVYNLLSKKTTVTSFDYREVLKEAKKSDIIYMDPPYQGVCGDRDSRYYSGIALNEFISSLEELNKRKIDYLISYDGRSGNNLYGEALPSHLDLILVELEAGRSSQATLLGRDEVTFESLYISRSLANKINAVPTIHYRKSSQQMHSDEVFL